MSQTVKIGIIGGGLMGKELASALGRWFVLEDELLALERALEHSNANTTVQRTLLEVFRTSDVGQAARSAYRKIGKAQRDLEIAVGRKKKENEEDDHW